MQPGLSRAVPMAVIGFMFGALLVILIRGIQGLDPIWAAGPGIVLSAIMMAVFFVWGMGAFNPKMSIHGEAHVVDPAEEAEAVAPRSLIIGSVWQLATIIILLIVVLGGFAALPGGLALTQTDIPYASPTSVGLVPFELPFGGPEIMVSQLVLFAVFVIWAFISLVLVAAVIAFIFTYLARGVTEVQAAGAGGGTAALPPPARREEPRGLRYTITTAAIFIVTFLILYVVFYYVAIGLILPNPDVPPFSWLGIAPSTQLVILSAVNAAIFTLLILRTQLVLNVIGIVARWLARVLRHLPRILQG